MPINPNEVQWDDNLTSTEKVNPTSVTWDDTPTADFSGTTGSVSSLSKAEADQARVAKLKADNPDMQWSSAGEGATKSFNADGFPYHAGAIGSTERWADSVVDANVGNLVQGAGSVVRNIGDLLSNSPVAEQMVASQPMLNLVPGADRGDLGGQLTAAGTDIAVGGGATQRRGQATFSVRRPDSLLQEPLQAAGYFANMGANSALPLGVSVALPEIGLSVMGAQSYGQEYGKRRDEGRSIGDSMMSAGIHGAAEIIPETKALHVITGALGSTGKKVAGDRIANALERNIAARVAGGTAAEAGSEGVTQIAQDSNDRFAMGDKITTEKMLGNLRDAMGAGAAMGGPAATADFVATHGSLKGDKPKPAAFVPPTQLRGAEASLTGDSAPPRPGSVGELFAGDLPAFEPAPASLADTPSATMPQQGTTAAVAPKVSVTSSGATVQPMVGQNQAAGMFDDLVPKQQSQAPSGQTQAAQNHQDLPPQNHATAGDIVSVPVAGLQLSRDVPQFKDGADASGVVEPIGGQFDERGTGPVQVWRRVDGRMEVISGRHRLDLARRSGKSDIAAQVYNEADGFTKEQAASLDAELNIRDGQGKVADYVQYFQRAGFQGAEGQQAAESRGLLARSTGKRAFTIARQGDDELIAAHRAGQITDEAAVQVAQAAPNNGALQALGMKQLQQGRSIIAATNTMRALGTMRGGSNTGDMFGFDDSAIKDAEAMAAVAARHQREIAERLAAISGAAKRPEIAKKEGIDVRDPQAIQRRIEQLRAERDEWQNWPTDPAKVAQVRQEAGIAEQGAEKPQPTGDDAGDTTAPEGSPEGGLFGAPTAQEVVQGASRAADDKRNGKTGAVTPGVGGLPLFAGDAPIQGDMGSNTAPASEAAADKPASEAGSGDTGTDAMAADGASRRSRARSVGNDDSTSTKVVDNNGDPLTVYHGTTADVTEFTDGHAANNTGHMTAPLGIFFDEKQGKAQHYAELASDGVPADENVIGATLTITNPKALTTDQLAEVDSRDEARALKKKLQGQGYDGIHITDAGQWVAFAADQVAIGDSVDDAVADEGYSLEDYDFSDSDFFGEQDAKDLADEAAEEADELRRIKKKKDNSKPPPRTTTRDNPGISYDLDIYTDNGYSEGEISNMPPSQQVKVATGIMEKTFGFKSVTVAANLNTLEAANHLRHAYRNLQSMAAVMGWPSATFGKIVPKLELVRDANGSLAYFHPGENAIAISRENDAFAHEFGHGIDWWVWKKMGYVDPMTGQPKGRGATGKLKLGASLASPDVEGALTNMLRTMYATHGDAALKIASLEKNILVIQKQIADMEAKAAKLLDDDRVAAIKDAIEKRKAHIGRVVEQIAAITKAPKASYKSLTDYYLNSRILDKKQASEAADGGYWQRPTEMFARAFEAYVAHKIEEAGGGFEFLGRSDAGYLQTSVDFIAKAYPQAMERQSIFESIDHLMSTLNNDLTAGVSGDLATVQKPNPIPAAAWRQWVPSQVKQVSIIGHIREVQDQAKAERLQNEAEDLPLKKAKQELRDARNPEQKAFAELQLRAIDIQLNARARWGASVTGWLHGMEKRYPNSGTFGQLSRMFTTTPGKGNVREETYSDFQYRWRKKWGNELEKIIDRHHLHRTKWSLEAHRQMRDAMVDWREDGERPDYPADVLAAADDLRNFHNDMHEWISDHLEKKGQTLGYAKNGYLTRIMNEASVAADQQGFLAAASSVYEEVFDREIGTPEKHDLSELVHHAGTLAETMGTPEARKLAQLARKLARADAAGDQDAVDEVRQQIDELLAGGLFDKIKGGFSRGAAEDYMARILGTVAADDFEVQGAHGNFAKSRTLPASADIKLGDYMVNDALALSATYLSTAVNKVTFENFITGEGGAAGRIGNIKTSLAKDGVLKDDIEEAMKVVSLLTGMYRPSSSSATRRTIANVSAWFTPVLLGRAMMAQVAEPATVVLRTGNPTDGMRLFGSVLEDLGAWLPLVNKAISDNSKSRGVWRREMAAFTGAVDSHLFSQIMNNRVGTMWATKKPGQKNAAFFTHTFIHPHAMSMRRGAVEVSFRYFKRIAKKAIAGNKLAQRDLADLGIDFGRDKALVQYLANEMPVMPMVSELSASPYAQQLSVAVNRFVDETVIEPKIADKARAASTAETSFMYSILSFQSGFTNNVLLRATDRVFTAFKKDGRAEGAKVTAATGIAFGVFLAAQTAQYLLRYAMFGKDDVGDLLERWKNDPLNAATTIASRSGVTGMLDPAVNLVTGVKYSRSFSDVAVGAYFGYGLQGLNKLVGSEFRNSTNTNTAERAQVQSVFDLAIAPFVAHMVLKRARILAPALAWTSSSRMRETVADALVGPKGAKTGHKSKTTTDSRHSSRHNGRGGGRSDGRDGGR